MTTAKNIGRIDVWPNNATAAAADTADSKLLRRMTIWQTSAAARSHREYPADEGGGGSDWLLSGGTWNDSGVWDDTAVWEDAA